jgi:uncharacterized membrane protein YgcG
MQKLETKNQWTQWSIEMTSLLCGEFGNDDIIDVIHGKRSPLDKPDEDEHEREINATILVTDANGVETEVEKHTDSGRKRLDRDFDRRVKAYQKQQEGLAKAFKLIYEQLGSSYVTLLQTRLMSSDAKLRIRSGETLWAALVEEMEGKNDALFEAELHNTLLSLFRSFSCATLSSGPHVPKLVNAAMDIQRQRLLLRLKSKNIVGAKLRKSLRADPDGVTELFTEHYLHEIWLCLQNSCPSYLQPARNDYTQRGQRSRITNVDELDQFCRFSVLAEEFRLAENLLLAAKPAAPASAPVLFDAAVAQHHHANKSGKKGGGNSGGSSGGSGGGGQKSSGGHGGGKSSTSTSTPTTSTTPRPPCVHCQKGSHKSEDCWSKFPEKRPKGARPPQSSTAMRQSANTSQLALDAEAYLANFEAFSAVAPPLFTTSVKMSPSTFAHIASTAALVEGEDLAMVDGGASTHMLQVLSVFRDFKRFPRPAAISLAGDGKYIYSPGFGDVLVEMTGTSSVVSNDSASPQVLLRNVLYVPHLSHTLLNPYALEHQQIFHYNRPGVLHFYQQGRCKGRVGEGTHLFRATAAGGKPNLRFVRMKVVPPESGPNEELGALPDTCTPLPAPAPVASAKVAATIEGLGGPLASATESSAAIEQATTIETANRANSAVNSESQQALREHERLGHPGKTNHRALRTAAKGVMGCHKLSYFCSACQSAKQQARPYPSRPATQRAKALFERVHFDVCGPITPAGPNKEQYFGVVVDEFTRHGWLLTGATRTAIWDKFQDLEIQLENIHGTRFKTVHCDNAPENPANEFIRGTSPATRYLKSRGIAFDHSTPYVPQQNGIAERFNRTLLERIRCFAADSQVPLTLWPFLAHVAVSYINTTVANPVTAYQRLFGYQPDLSPTKLPRLFCTAFMLLPGVELASKVAPRAIKTVYLGKAVGVTGGYWLYHPPSGKVYTSSNVVFHEEENGMKSFQSLGDATPELLHIPSPFEPSLAPDGHVPSNPNPSLPTASGDPSPPVASSLPVSSLSVSVPTPVVPSTPVVVHPTQDSGPRVSFGPYRESDSNMPRPSLPRQSILRLPSAPPTPAPTSMVTQPSVMPSPIVAAVVSPPIVSGPAARPRRANAGVPFQGYDRQHFEFSNVATGELPEWSLAGVHLSPEFASFLGTIHTAKQAALVYEYAYSALGKDPIPKSYYEAVTGPNRDKWLEAIAREKGGILKNSVFSECDPPVGIPLVRTRWVFDIKMKSDGTVERYKARLVIKGYEQIAGIHYNETHAPVVHMEALRTVLSIAGTLDWNVEHCDIVNAFLHGEIQEELYVTVPDGFESAPGKVFKVVKALYGAKQAGREYNKKLDAHLKANGYVPCLTESCTYTKRVGQDRVIVCIWVDDLFITGSSQTLINALKADIRKEFETKDLGELKWALGMEVHRDRAKRTITLTHRNYLRAVLSEFDMLDCSPVAIPFANPDVFTHTAPPMSPEDRLSMASIPYRKAIGCLMYAAVHTRPDILSSVVMASQFMQDPRPEHWEQFQHLFRYVKGTLDLGLVLGGVGTVRLGAYTDANWGGKDTSSRQSTTGFCISLCTPSSGPPSGFTVFKSSKQTCIAQSTMESEFIAASACAKSIFWLRQFLAEIGFPQKSATPLLCDNEAAIKFSKSSQTSSSGRHIDLRVYLCRDMISKGIISMSYVNTSDNTADILTKPLKEPSVQEKHRTSLGICHVGRPTRPTA